MRPFFPVTTGELRRIQRLRFWPLMNVLQEKYLLSYKEAEELSSFMLPMLRLQPDRRAMSHEMMHHSWLEGITIAGEEELAKRNEAQMRTVLSMSAELAHEQDALKPVGSLGSMSAESPSRSSATSSLSSSAATNPDLGSHADSTVPPHELRESHKMNNDFLRSGNAAGKRPADACPISSTATSDTQPTIHHAQAQPFSLPPPSIATATSSQPHVTTGPMAAGCTAAGQSCPHAMTQTPRATAILNTPRAGPVHPRTGSAHSRRAGSPSPHALPLPVATPVQ